MAETAKILNPERIVLVPDMEAGCSLADGCAADEFRAWRARKPEAIAISYINCSAAVKAESDLICTSSNAEKVVRSVPEDREILFAPEEDGTRVTIRHSNLPDHGMQYRQGWNDAYLNPMKVYFGSINQSSNP